MAKPVLPGPQVSTNLDFLRAIAVLAVLAQHIIGTFELSQGGWLLFIGDAGVYVFFVHTSLVLMHSMERLRARQESLFGSFYIRRFFRIYPLSIACLLVALWGQVPIAPWRGDYEWLGMGHVISNLLLTQNLTLSPSVVGPMWSLPYEIQMYLLLPLIFLLLARRPGLKTVAGLWLAVVAAGIVQPQLTERLSLARYAPCFIAGVAAYVLSKLYRPHLPAWGWPLAILGCLTMYLTFEEYRLVWHTPAGWITCLTLGLAIPWFEEIRSPLVVRSSHYVAKYSYGIYLCHMPILWLAFVKLADLPVAIQWSVFWTLMVAVPMIAFHALEDPMIRLGARVAAQYGKSRKKREDRRSEPPPELIKVGAAWQASGVPRDPNGG